MFTFCLIAKLLKILKKAQQFPSQMDYDVSEQINIVQTWSKIASKLHVQQLLYNIANIDSLRSRGIKMTSKRRYHDFIVFFIKLTKIVSWAPESSRGTIGCPPVRKNTRKIIENQTFFKIAFKMTSTNAHN